MSAPPPPPTLADREPLSHTRHIATRERDGALIGWQRAPGGTGAIGDPAVHWWACDEQWAPATRENPALPWPPFWSLELFREVVERRSGYALSDLDAVRRRAPGIAANMKIRQVGADVGGQEPMPCICTHPDCKKRGGVQSMHPSGAKRGVGLSCCYGGGQTAEQRTRGPRTLARRAGVRHIAEIAVGVPWLVPLFGPDDYSNNRTHLPYRCLRCGGVHQIRPQDAVRGRAKCGSSRAQPMANGRDLAEVSRMGVAALGLEGLRAAGRRGAAVTGPANFTQGGDSIIDWARGVNRPREGEQHLYIFHLRHHPGLIKVGITASLDSRPDGQYGDLVASWSLNPLEVCAIETVIKRTTQHQAVVPAGLEGWGGRGEIRSTDPEQLVGWIEEVLLPDLAELGPWSFALRYIQDLAPGEELVLREKAGIHV